MLTSIIILTHNQLAYTKECISSIRSHTTKEKYELIIVDNASIDGTVEWIKTQSDIILIQNSENIGFPAGCNQGIRKSKGNNILLLNNDVVVTKNWLTNLLNCLYSGENIGAVGPVTNYASYASTIPVSYTNLNEMQKFAANHNQLDMNKWEERLKLIGFCMLIKRKILDEIGLLDERFTPGNFEDDDLSIRMLQHGYKLYLCRDTFVHHYGSISWKENIPIFSKTLDLNSQKFKEKWSFNAEKLSIYYGILSKIEPYIKDYINILHVGAGCGATLLALKQRYPNVYVYGVENNSHAARLSNQVAPTVQSEYEHLQDIYPKKKFDIVLLTAPIPKVKLNLLVNSIESILTSNGIMMLSQENSQNYTELQNEN